MISTIYPTISVTCPAEIARVQRQARNRTRERNPTRRAAVKAWCIGKLCSCGCKRPANCAHHPSDDLYQDEWANLSECEPYYSGCHYMHHKGFVRCLSCGKWMKPGTVCWSCKPETEREWLIYRKEQRQRDRNRHNRQQAKKAQEWKRKKIKRKEVSEG